MNKYNQFLQSAEFDDEGDDVLQEKCCEIYISKFKRIMVFKCSLCNDSKKSFASFIRHLLEEHFYEDDTVGEDISTQYEVLLTDEADDQSDQIYKSPNNTDLDNSNLDDGPAIDMDEFNVELANDVSEVDDACSENSQEPDCSEPILAEYINETIEIAPDALVQEKELEKISQFVLGIHACDQCDRVYKTSRALKTHKRLHENTDRKFVCEECGFAFTDNGNLRHHIRRFHSQEKHYKCPECPRSFYGRSEMSAHMRLHTGERPYVCSTCGKTYRHLSTLNSHYRIHTGTRPYLCNLCGKSFRSSSRYKEHLAVHTGNRTHVCSICGTTFTRAKTLKTHMKLHENKREYACSLCDNSFNQRPALLSHLKTRHKIVSAPKV